MHAWICTTPTGPDALEWQARDTPEPAPNEVRIRIAAASLNFPDLLMVQYKYQVKPPLPFVPGVEFSGTVEAMGEKVRGLQIGMRVASFGGLGGFATHACVPYQMVTPIPDSMSFEDAAAFLCTYGTSHHALLDRARLAAGETVLVLGAAGGVGTAAIQIAATHGARVIAAVSSEAKAEVAKRLGASDVIRYDHENLRDRLKELTGGLGPNVVYDPVGGAQAEPAFRSIAWRGRYLVVGFAEGAIPALPLNLPLLKGADLVGVFWGEFARREPAAYREALGAQFAAYVAGHYRPVLHQVLPMQDLKKGFDELAGRRVCGKVVLRND